jgi:7,8-dihydropterin-6-yl-methyl-4-(beta-D-ribofuranosyl)aminobenzene 5'-phosphate synthase
MKRRDFLKSSAALAGAAVGGFSCVEYASAKPIQTPIVDKLSVRVLVDVTHNIFLRPITFNGVALTPAPRAKNYTKVLHTQWGLSLLLESVKAGEQRTLMLDYAYTPEALLNNMDIIGVDAKKIDALIVSHGHFDHYGGLIGFLDKYRRSLPADIKLLPAVKIISAIAWCRPTHPAYLAIPAISTDAPLQLGTWASFSARGPP